MCGFVVLAGAASASAQMGVGMRAPQFQGVWNPVVSSGGVYQVEGKNERKTAMQMFDTIGPLFGRPNPLRGTTATGTQNAALRLQEGLV